MQFGTIILRFLLTSIISTASLPINGSGVIIGFRSSSVSAGIGSEENLTAVVNFHQINDRSSYPNHAGSSAPTIRARSTRRTKIKDWPEWPEDYEWPKWVALLDDSPPGLQGRVIQALIQIYQFLYVEGTQELNDYHKGFVYGFRSEKQELPEEFKKEKRSTLGFVEGRKARNVKEKWQGKRKPWYGDWLGVKQKLKKNEDAWNWDEILFIGHR